jgi:3-methylfumaryl-CoA hydratase
MSGEAPPLIERDIVSASAVRRIAAMLDLDRDELGDDALLPRGWHFPLLAAQTPRRALRSDGFPGLGVPMPDLGLPRLLLVGRTLSFAKDLAIGASAIRTTGVRKLDRKDDDRGSRAIMTIEHGLADISVEAPAILETQTYMLLPAGRYTPAAPVPAPPAPVDAEMTRTVTPDATLLFQYSALGFNSHRIHLDRDYACTVEGYPDLVVNGGLTSLLMTEFVRRDLRLTLDRMRVRYLAPLFANRPIQLAASRRADGWQLRVYDDAGRLAVDADVEAS